MSRLDGRHFTAAEIRPTNPGRPADTGYVGLVKLQFRLADGCWSTAVDSVLDTGATHSCISRDLAGYLGIDLSDPPDGEFTSATGRERVWHRTRYVRFAELDDRQFKLLLLIPEGGGPAEPLLGLRDIYRNFEMATRDEQVYFLLKAAHAGEPYPAG